MQAFVPKNRRPKFEFKLRIIDLNNIPLVVGLSYAKWHLPSSTSAEHRGQTDKAVIQDHRASWDYEKVLPVRLTVDRNQMLQECQIHFEIFQEFNTGGRGDKHLLGNVRLNLAEYVEKNEDGEGVTRRYLMQDSKINGTLKVGIVMHQVEGDTNFITPPLKTAMVFGGIGGFISAEQGDLQNSSSIPSINSWSREAGDLQDMYRRSLAASWACRAGELSPDRLIEDIFAGGDGWETGGPSLRLDDDNEDRRSFSDADSRRTIRDGTDDGRSKLSYGRHQRGLSKNKENLEHSGYGIRERTRKTREVSEFDLREDLRSWEIFSPQ
ncbi:conserved hypothetical protein [Histoplasma capsulatum var. duboisii H88]|uniref:Eeig1 superfamily domain-containing protein n=2 Tax=Ajellomyces capsulatus TaxID=5037 RepID=F0U984_AJEC8|nr:conserved hypothetical protein [Histoplasma capsulatum var. duboisii H88]KAG5287656.1 Eeig1 superfamily domain-containing protein [Histoplasma capsulatum]QSS52534.1 Eeig1 superfamily domain-containing protein [Histoplasma capsulatum var. duboisii H88]QSS70530.1 Eeig1 superfamily domain-containing protein [Histoplasma capsulatum G186AR]